MADDPSNRPPLTAPVAPAGLALARRLFAPVDGASIAVFRAMLGAVLFMDAAGRLESGWVRRVLIAPEFHFKYFGFGWVEPLPGEGMIWVFRALAAAAACLALGLFYRAAAAALCLGFTYVFLCEASAYQNHNYLECLVCGIMIFVPAHRTFSLDALMRRALRSDDAPAWSLALLRFQFGLVYFFGGIAKLNSEWLAGYPMRLWFSEPRPMNDFAFDWPGSEATAIFMTWGGLALDLLFVPLALWRPTRGAMLLAAGAFHLFNSQIFAIDVFPWMMLAANLLFLAPDWPRVSQVWPRKSPLAAQEAPRESEPPKLTLGRRAALWALGAYCAVQCLLPLRFLLYPGETNWTDQGHRFAWRMMLREKRVVESRFTARNPATGEEWEAKPADFLTRDQTAALSRPDLALQTAHALARREADRRGIPRPEVRARVVVSLNERPPQPMIDPTADLAAIRPSLLPATWILPAPPRQR